MARAVERVLVGARLPVTLARALRIEAAKRDTSVQALIEEAVRRLLKGRA
jgi:hypothetical protein